MAVPTTKRIRALAHFQALLAAGGNGTEAVRRERPWLTPGSAATAAWRRNRRMREALVETDYRELLEEALPNVFRAGRLRELAENAPPAVSLRAIQWTDRVLGHGAQRVGVSKRSLHVTRSAFFGIAPSLVDGEGSGEAVEMPALPAPPQGVCPHCGKALPASTADGNGGSSDMPEKAPGRP